jgi:hypothetical protein
VNTTGITANTVARSGIVLLARIVGAAGAYITQATLSAIAYQVRDVDEESNGFLTPLAISTVVFDALQTGGAWDKDTTGYNFAATIPASEFTFDPDLAPDGTPKPRRFRVDVRFTPTSGEQFVVPWDLTVLPTWIGG